MNILKGNKMFKIIHNAYSLNKAHTHQGINFGPKSSGESQGIMLKNFPNLGNPVSLIGYSGKFREVLLSACFVMSVKSN